MATLWSWSEDEIAAADVFAVRKLKEGWEEEEKDQDDEVHIGGIGENNEDRSQWTEQEKKDKDDSRAGEDKKDEEFSEYTFIVSQGIHD
jgi:hypothetical protein